MNKRRNVFAMNTQLPPDGPELCETLATGAGSVRLERIVSNGQVTPEDEWYDQNRDEWVVVLEGEARLRYADGEELDLKRGDALFLPRHKKHRVTYTSSPCLWLAIHADSLSPQPEVALKPDGAAI